MQLYNGSLAAVRYLVSAGREARPPNSCWRWGRAREPPNQLGHVHVRGPSLDGASRTQVIEATPGVP